METSHHNAAAISKNIIQIMTNILIRLFDFVFSLIGLIVGLPILLVLFIVGLLDTGAPIFTQTRVGRDKKPFTLVKFRTMKKDTAHVASHLASRDAITAFGHFLRRTKLDELPQLWNVLKGEMSLVGPRPCLFNQIELIRERDKHGAFAARPGVTGLAQIKGIDMSEPALLAELDAQMITDWSLKNYFIYIWSTIKGAGQGDRVR